jgi:glycosyltransferase involved in cell wall biosynthesis
MDSEPNMNILLVAEHFYPYGGAELSLWKLCGVLSRKGHKIYVITARRNGETDYEVKDGIEIYRPFSTGNTMQRFIFAVKLYPYLKKWLRDKDIDIIYNLGYVATLPATSAAAKHGIPAVTMLSHLCGKKWFKLTNPFSAILNYFTEIFTIRFGKHRVLVVQCQESARKVAYRTRAEIQVICNTFLEPDGLKEAEESTDVKKVRETLRIGEDELFLLFVGALIRTKNAASLVKTSADLRKRFRLVLVGDGPERGKIEGLVKRLNLKEKVVLLGQKPHDETMATIRACDALVLSSICEQVPNVVLEALALGKPVISTKVGGVPEIKSANLHLIDNLEEISQILNGGIEAKEEDRIVEEYLLDNVAGQYERLFARLTGSKIEAKRV